jgi:hypothetical protein
VVFGGKAATKVMGREGHGCASAANQWTGDATKRSTPKDRPNSRMGIHLQASFPGANFARAPVTGKGARSRERYHVAQPPGKAQAA